MYRLMLSFAAVVLFSTFLVAAQDATAGPPGPPPIAAMEFGSGDVGPVGKPRGHPSAHAADSIRPRTVVISAGGSVMFKLPGGVHQVAIYAPGKKPGDFDRVDVTKSFAGCAGGRARYIDDTDLLVEVVADPPCATGPTMVSSSAETFDEPGRYLVICTFDSHFFDMDMYGWVIVK